MWAIAYPGITWCSPRAWGWTAGILVGYSQCMDIVILGFLLIPLALASGSILVWGLIGLAFASPFVCLLLGLVLRIRR